jgi:hypothetical protein
MPIMRTRLVSAALLVALLLGLAAPAQADIFNALGRRFGIGWSDGYHARDACCPGPVWALRKGHSPPRQTHYGPAWPYYEPLPMQTYGP